MIPENWNMGRKRSEYIDGGQTRTEEGRLPCGPLNLLALAAI